MFEVNEKNNAVHHIVTKNTVDEDVLAALASKDVTQEKLIAAVKARL